MSTARNRSRRLLTDLVAGLVLCLAGLAMGGCIARPSPTTLYTLTPLAADTAPLAAQRPSSAMIMVLPARLPPQLRQQGMVVDEAGSAPRVLLGHLWAGPLDAQIGATLVANLQTLLASPNVTLYPGPRYATPRLQVETEIIHFGGDLQHFTLRAITTISDTQERRILSRQSFSQTAALGAPDYTAYAQAASGTLAALARAVAATLTTLMPPDSPQQAR